MITLYTRQVVDLTSNIKTHTNLFKENKFNELSIADRKDAGIYAAKKLEPPELSAKLPGEHWKQPEELLRAKTLLTRPAEHSWIFDIR